MRKDREWLAERVSDIFNPFYLNIPLIFFIALVFAPNIWKGLGFAFIASLAGGILPMVEIWRRIRKGEASDPHLSNREERIKPLSVGLAITFAGLLLLVLFKAPIPLIALLGAGFLSGTVLVGITSVCKISLHAAGVTGVATALTILYGYYGLPLWLLVMVVWWARYTLGQHNAAQLMAGSAVSAIVTFTTFYFLGLVK